MAGDLPPKTGSARVIREDPKTPDLLFIGTEFGAYVSLNRGKRWEPFGSNFPSVRVDDIQIHSRDHDLIVATHGRSLWILDDITPLEQMTRAALRAEMTLFDLRPATAWRRIETSSGAEAQKPFAAPNPPYGAVINYNLPKTVKDKIVVTVLDTEGEEVRRLDGTDFQGLNRVIWDLHYRSPAALSAEQNWATAGGFFYKNVEVPKVEPGEYTIRITTGNQSASKKIVVSDDPDVTISAQDRAARHDAMVRALNLYRSAVEGADRLRDLKASLTSAMDSWKAENAAPIPEPIRAQAEALSKSVEVLSPLFTGPADPMNPPLVRVPPPVTERVAHVFFTLESYTSAPRTRDTELLTELAGIERDALARLKQLLDVDLARFNKALAESGVAYVALPVRGSEPH